MKNQLVYIELFAGPMDTWVGSDNLIWSALCESGGPGQYNILFIVSYAFCYKIIQYRGSDQLFSANSRVGKGYEFFESSLKRGLKTTLSSLMTGGRTL